MPKRIKPQEIKVVVPEGVDPTPLEIMEQSIIDIAKAFKALSATRIQKDVIVTVVSRKSGVGRGDVEHVLSYLHDLERLFLNPKKQ